MKTWKEIVKEASKRNDFKITYADGNSVTTGFNGTLEDAKAYWKVGQKFNIGDGKGGDKMVKVTKVEQLNEDVNKQLYPFSKKSHTYRIDRVSSPKKEGIAFVKADSQEEALEVHGSCGKDTLIAVKVKR